MAKDRPLGLDSHGVSIAPASHWPLDVLVAVVILGQEDLCVRNGADGRVISLLSSVGE